MDAELECQKCKELLSLCFLIAMNLHLKDTTPLKRGSKGWHKGPRLVSFTFISYLSRLGLEGQGGLFLYLSRLRGRGRDYCIFKKYLVADLTFKCPVTT